MIDKRDSTHPPRITIEFVGGPFCGAVLDSRDHPLRASVLRRLLTAARSERAAELRLRQFCTRRMRVAVGKENGSVNAEGERFYRYRLLLELGFSSRVLFRADYAGVVLS